MSSTEASALSNMILSTNVESDVVLMVLVTAIALVVVLLFWKEIKLLLFDSDYANTTL